MDLHEMRLLRQHFRRALVGRRAVAWPAYVVICWLENRPSACPPVSG